MNLPPDAVAIDYLPAVTHAPGVGRYARELVRAHHVGDLTVLVHPLARGRGGGRQLVSAIITAASTATWPHKLAVRVAADDEPLRRTLLSTGAPWVRERVEQGALRRGTALFDVERWGLVLDA